MHILGYLIAGFIGFMIGVILSCILLAQKNLEKAQQIEQRLKDNVNIAKTVYKAEADRIDGITETTESEDSNEEMY
ncbi:MAG: hypothetical protein NC489_15715 [Ruminococcus flavefaciens]|nr:hypothetical protein [Ruminococcus flavefaciens]